MCTASELCIGMRADVFPQAAGSQVFGSGKVLDALCAKVLGTKLIANQAIAQPPQNAQASRTLRIVDLLAENHADEL
jgi:hypothetical protein